MSTQEKQFDPSDFAKDEIHDLVNQIFHDAAAVWQFVDQGDPEEGLTLLHSIHGRCNEIEIVLEESRLPQTAPEQVATLDLASMIGDCDWCGAPAVDVIVRDGTPLAYYAKCRDADFPLKEAKEGE